MPVPAEEVDLNERTWRTVSILLAVVLAGMLGFAGILVLTGSPSPGPSATLPATASSGPSGSAAAATSASPGGSPSGAASTTATAAPTPTPIPSSPMTTVTFQGLKLDASADPNGQKRTFTFTSNGPGAVTVRLTGANATDKTLLCFSVGTQAPTCRTWAGGTLTGTADTVSDTWTVTLIGQGVSQPTVNLSLTWPVSQPSVKVSGARFDATGTPGGFNGLVVNFLPRSSGQAHFSATWGPVSRPWPMHLDLRNVSTNAVVGQTDVSEVAAVDSTYPVSPASGWALEFFNTSGLNPGPLWTLGATISWP